MNIQKKLLTYLFISFTCIASAQESTKSTDKVTLQNDTVYRNGTPEFIIRSRSNEKNPGMNLYSIFSLEHKPQALLISKLINDTIHFSARFPELNVAYDCLYPKVDLITLIESYLANKIMVKGEASREGLEQYCKSRNLSLREIPKRAVSKPGMDPAKDSIMAIHAKERLEKQFKFNLQNKSKKEVNIFLGDTTSSPNRTKNPNVIPFRQGRYEIVKAGETKELIGFEGEYISITDSLHILYNSKLLKKDIKSLTVKGDAKKFD